MSLLEVRGLKKRFTISRYEGFRQIKQTVFAVDGIDLDVAECETVGLVGESGCGKSTAGRAILRLIQPDEGSVRLGDSDLLALKGEELRKVRKSLGVVFQDPYSALNPRMLIGDIVSEPLRVHGLVQGKAEAWKRSRELLERVGLRSEFVNRYPHEFSGGQRQRIGIARAIGTDPKLVILDEPISALDVSIRAQILNLLADLQQESGLSYIFIAHDLSIVRHFCDKVNVMYLGIIVEKGTSDSVFTNPRHPYTRALLSAIPSIHTHTRPERMALEGDVPSPTVIPSGCRFRTRCPLQTDRCAKETPLLRPTEDGHFVACHFA